MKKIIGLLGLAFIMILCSCDDNSENEKIRDSKQTITASTASTSISNETISIYDINNAKIGEIERYGVLVLTDDSTVANALEDCCGLSDDKNIVRIKSAKIAGFFSYRIRFLSFEDVKNIGRFPFRVKNIIRFPIVKVMQHY